MKILKKIRNKFIVQLNDGRKQAMTQAEIDELRNPTPKQNEQQSEENSSETSETPEEDEGKTPGFFGGQDVE